MNVYARAHTHTSSDGCLPELAAERGDLPCHGLTAVRELLQLSLQLPLLSVGARVLLLHLFKLPLQLLQPDHRLVQLADRGEEKGGEGAVKRKRRKRTYCRGRGETWDWRKEGNKKREKGQISLGTGRLIGIRIQIKFNRLLLMMFWQQSQCLAERFIFRVGIHSTFPINTDAAAGLGLVWTEPDKSLILGWFFNTLFVPLGTIRAASLADLTLIKWLFNALSLAIVYCVYLKIVYRICGGPAGWC